MNNSELLAKLECGDEVDVWDLYDVNILLPDDTEHYHVFMEYGEFQGMGTATQRCAVIGCPIRGSGYDELDEFGLIELLKLEDKLWEERNADC